MEHHENGRLDEAALLYKRVLAQAPETPPALFNLGLIHNTRMDFSEAIGCYRKAVEITASFSPWRRIIFRSSII